MLNYIVDEKRMYDEVLLESLRSYNTSQVGQRPYEERVFYVYKDGNLLASAKTSLSWDWVSPYNFFYKDEDSLFALLNEIVRFYKGRAVGINTSSFVDFVIHDLLAYGFKDAGRMKNFYQGKDRVALQLRDWQTKQVKEDYKIVHVKETLEEEKESWQNLFDDFIHRCAFPMETEEVQVVCLDGDDFVGGVMGYIQFGMLYVSLLVVRDAYRKKGVARKLMTMIEDYVRKDGVQVFHLGTGSFQARGFYEKLGYEICYEQVDKPKGHSVYTMMKRDVK
jgi:GNAT superfamily N-acetyltransferase